MKKLLLSTLCCLLCVSSLQAKKNKSEGADPNPLLTENNFVAVSQFDYMWQKVYDIDLDAEQIKERVLQGGFFASLPSQTTNNISGRSRQMAVLYKESGYSRGVTPVYLLDSGLEGNVRVDIKDGSYRVTLSDIVVVGGGVKFGAYSGGMSVQSNKNMVPIFSYILNGKGTVKQGMTSQNGAVKMVNYSFNKAFDINIIEVGDDW